MMVKKKNNNNRKKFDGCEVFLFRHIIFCFFIFLHYFHYGYGSSLGDAHSAPHNSMRIRYIYERVLCCVHAVGTVCHWQKRISSVFVAPSWKMNYRRFCLGLSCTSRAYTHTHTLTYIVIWISFRRRFDGFSSLLFDFWRFCERLLPPPSPSPLLLLLLVRRIDAWFDSKEFFLLLICLLGEREHPRTSELIFFYV